ncbi:DUF1206 domain-containing protein [Deinococcus aquaticus]|uniref:DUF1206 domain-containing protein n=1 Tax=Deinococcus aquaticus TaxID=328692 RepID=A0ABY7V404_9DEIO|nr:DUF1206 domain-containing protein [Deinococcus aquaticus]WDA59922.1 DUF1206 domain-containing protein [Deinococcus aquaticus]
MADLKNVNSRVSRGAEQVKAGLQDTREAAGNAAQQAAPGLETLARVGYASKGVVYFTVGFLALSVALGRGGRTTDTRGALLKLQDLPGGSALLAVVAVGLVGYALWQLIRAVLDPERQGTAAKGIAKRLGYLLSGGVNLTLAVFTARLAASGSAPQGGDSQAQAAGTVLNLPGGQLLLGLVGLGLLALAGSQLFTAYGAKFMKRMNFAGVNGRVKDLLVKTGQLGIGSRGVLMLIIGGFALVAAWNRKASETVGISQALTWLNSQPSGNLLLGLVAVGTLCYGVWCVVQARYRRIRIQDAA